MPRRPQPRSALPSPKQISPEFGARHPIVYDDELDIFFTKVYQRLEKIIPLDKNFDDHANLKRIKRAFRLYDDPRRVGVSVLERRLPRTYAQKQRVKWTPNDLGRVKGKIQDELARLSFGNKLLEATFNQVVRLGDVDDGPNARKLGLVLEQNTDVAELLVREHELIIEGISGSLKRFRYPYDEYIPHWTIARISRNTGSKPLNQTVSAIQEMLPLTVQLEPIHLYSEQDIGL